jgi:hypothetical protein
VWQIEAHNKFVCEYIFELDTERDDASYLAKRSKRVADMSKKVVDGESLDNVLVWLRKRDTERLRPTYMDEDLNDAEIKRRIEDDDDEAENNLAAEIESNTSVKMISQEDAGSEKLPASGLVQQAA